MDANKAIITRKSIRGFLDKEISRENIKEIIDIAKQSPSYKNTQPWEVMVISGERKKELSRKMIELLEMDTQPQPDIITPKTWPAKEQANIDKLFAMRKKATGLDLSEPKIINKSKRANFNFYNAPHAIYLYQDNSLTPWSIFDMGLFAQSLMLAAHEKGFATVPQAFVTDYAPQIKEFLQIPTNKRLVLGLSLGYPDMNAAINQLDTDRMSVDEFTIWLE